jgi:ABC-2 type transport system permease protein
MIRSIIRKEIQVLLKEKGTFFWLFLLPILFILMFASIFGNISNTFTVQYYDADNSAESIAFVNVLKKIPGFELKTDTKASIETQVQKIRDGKATSLLVIPQGYASMQKKINLQNWNFTGMLRQIRRLRQFWLCWATSRVNFAKIN